MSANFTTVRAALKAKIATVTDFTDPDTGVVRVDDFHRAELLGYPSCTFDVSDNSDDFLTNVDNMRTITYQIVIYQEVNGVGGLEQATTNLDLVTDKVIAAIESDYQLANGSTPVVDWCDAVNVGKRTQFTHLNGLVLAQELSVKANYSVLIV